MKSLPKIPTIAPSLLSADFANLANEVKWLDQLGNHWIHLDVMDGHFVPNLTIGPVVASAVRRNTQSFLDCHLMVSEPQKWIEPFAQAGADCVTMHIEAAGKKTSSLIAEVKKMGMKAGLSLSPKTDISKVEPYLEIVDLVLVMTVEPGFGGQAMLNNCLDKIRFLSSIPDRSFLIQADGGINPLNISNLLSLGAEVFVVGSALFKSEDRDKTYLELRKAIRS